MEVNTLVEKVADALKPALTELAKTILDGKTESVKEPQTCCDEEPEQAAIDGGTAVAERLDEVLEKVNALIDGDRKFNKMHEELDNYRKGLYRKLLSPILKNLVVQYAKINDLQTFYEKKQQEEDKDLTVLFSNLLKEYQNLKLSLSDLLYDYDIEIVEPQAGEEFNPKLHKALKIVSTDQPDQDRLIAACLTPGFKDMQANEQIVRYPEVEIFKLNQ